MILRCAAHCRSERVCCWLHDRSVLLMCCAETWFGAASFKSPSPHGCACVAVGLLHC
jgi:hypothetical protein